MFVGFVMNCGGQPMNKSVLYPSKISIYRPQNGTLAVMGKFELIGRNWMHATAAAFFDCTTRNPDEYPAVIRAAR